MRGLRLPATLAAVLLALGAAGCSTPCQDLGNRICNCILDPLTRTNCENDVTARVKAASPTGSEQDYCDSLLGTCPDPKGNVTSCAWLDTCEGKVACGMALPTPNGCQAIQGAPLTSTDAF